MNRAGPGDEIDLRSVLEQKSCTFDRALSRSDYCHAPVAERNEIRMFRRMGSERRRQSIELGRPVAQARNPGGDHYPPRPDALAIRQQEAETFSALIDTQNG